ncbi:MAG: hypothetical protein ACREXS_06065 [Gammaproteobacteria bacterium]
MTVESYFELFLALFGWQQYNHLWEILTGTGLAYLPFLFILLLNIIGPITSQETRDAATSSAPSITLSRCSVIRSFQP